MPTLSDMPTLALLRFNRQVLDQALALVVAHEAPGAAAFAGPVGAHLRHIIEHYEALLMPAQRGAVDYDGRPRDRELERSTDLARQRIVALLHCLSCSAGLACEQPVRVGGLGGLAGDFVFGVVSTIGRELVFVASHAIHHFALLQAHCKQSGIHISADFGKAPATVAHQRASGATEITAKESTCTASLQAA
jgi:hypothetical protein